MQKYILVLLILNILTSNMYAKKDKKKASTTLSINYPVTKKIDYKDNYFGTEIVDEYQWLENDTSAETEHWVDEQNKITDAYLDKIPYRNQLKERYQQLYNYEKISNTFFAGDYILYKKNGGLQNQAIIYIQKGTNENPEIFIDPNSIDKAGLTSYDIAGISNNNQYIAMSINKAGSDWSSIEIYDINTKQKLNDEIDWVKFTGASWYKNGFFYSRYPEPEKGKELSNINQYHCIYYHTIGTAQSEDKLIFKDEKEPLSFNSISVSEDEKYLFRYRSIGTYGNEVYWKKADDLTSDFKPLFTGFKNEYAVITVKDGLFYVYTDEGASNKQLIAVNPEQNEPSKWKKIIPEQKDALLENIEVSSGKLFAVYLQNACNKLFVYNIDGTNKKEIALPGSGNIEFFGSSETNQLVAYSYNSFNYPNSIFIYNSTTGYSNLFLKPTLQFNPEDYESKQVWYKSKDNTKVSMFIVHKKGIELNGKNPTYLYAYGGFNINMTPFFSASTILLLENGAVFAMPNLRGGGEYGDKWHKAGMLFNKQNVFDDFIAAAEYLIKEKYTSKNKLAISGGSNGGLLVGATITQRPDICKVAFPAVGVLDMLKYHKFTIGWGWIPEYGSSEQSKEMFEYLKGYSPLHNLKIGTNYPATLITTGDHDDRVVPAHSFKFAAKLQEYSSKINPALIRIEKNAGHGKGKPTSKIVEEIADKWSFFFWNVGIKSLQKK
ncbi:MAG: S9 family peptidase [Sphingobacteriales bacterium]|nr:MAG: S9 family peptidase [Sphingobacteriales bacterium]